MASNVRSSLVYQLLLHAHRIYSVLFFFAMIFLYFYKGSVLPYQYHVRVLELLIILAFAPIEAIRISWGTRGNLTETPAFLAFSLLLSVPVILIHVYLAIFQNYGKHTCFLDVMDTLQTVESCFGLYLICVSISYLVYSSPAAA
ncbi:hypothetical protein OESDEN_02894 [Oesophagostomum dentatum]|uniref:Uncharacterized protein n=1 Tax=Oesophagostomum dentatum TaxID=61180 RepID=A0A0B1TM54_OESDE|nr:hypothetical protein OESDEN_02894 [Oesophagostomum dentatum]